MGDDFVKYLGGTMYSFQTGVWKTFKNWLVQLVPAISAGWLAFMAQLPVEYQGVASAIGMFVGYFFKNWIENRD